HGGRVRGGAGGRSARDRRGERGRHARYAAVVAGRGADRVAAAARRSAERGTAARRDGRGRGLRRTRRARPLPDGRAGHPRLRRGRRRCGVHRGPGRRAGPAAGGTPARPRTTRGTPGRTRDVEGEHMSGTRRSGAHPPGRLRGIVAVCVAVLMVAACGNPLRGGAEGGDEGRIVIGASDVGESLLLAEIYAGALRSAGADDVTVRPPVGGREVLVQALQDRSVTLAPDYSGNLLRYFDENTGATTSEEVSRELPGALPDGLEVLTASPAQNTDMLVVRGDLAAQGVRSISDLAPRCDRLVFGGPGQWADRWRGQIRKLYGCEFAEIRTTDTGGPVTVEALRSGEVQVANMLRTSASVRANGFVPLDDDRHMVPVQYLVPLAAAGSLSTPERAALDRVSAALTTEKLTELNVEFSERKRNPADIADEFLARLGEG